MTAPLAGFRILDLSRVLAGPYCTMLLGDLGAEVIKVERPGVGDDTRTWGPPFVGGESAYYLCANRNKKSLTVNLKTPAGQDIIRQLARMSDVLVENFKVGELAALGLGYDDLKPLHPGLVYCSITGYGQTGPDKDLPGYDFIIQGRGGVMSITGEPEGEPMKVGVAVVDITAGLFAANAIQAALLARSRTGRGQAVDIALLDAQVAWLANVASSYLMSGQRPQRFGNAHPTIVPYQTFRARDGYFCLAVGNDGQWRNLCEVLQHPELARDGRFATNPQRVQHREELIARLQDIFATDSIAVWLRKIAAAGVPCGPVQTLDQVFTDPQVLARSMVWTVPHPTAGEVRFVGSPLKLSEAPVSSSAPPPLLGEHTYEVLTGLLGYTPEYVDRLRAEGVV
ncbi:MAG TPA: CaiB/BaiF CoA-transferase family protein [Methylomirabilota bacterium]|nr:CaiB/BaiF CoA-transferase family protein [Methylomirabilota bacterium]